MSKSAAISLLSEIANNKGGNQLNHHEVRVLAHGLISVLPDIEDIPTLWADEIELLLKMLSKGGTPHHARCVIAGKCLEYLRHGGEEKKSNSPTSPENF